MSMRHDKIIDVLDQTLLFAASKSVPILAMLITFGLGLGCAVLLTRLAITLGIKLGIADVPGGRRRHARITSRLGVLPLFGAFALAALISQRLGVDTTDRINEPIRFTGLLIGGAIIAITGFLDDRFDLPSTPQFVVQGLCALIAIASLVFIERFTFPLPLIDQQIVLTEVFQRAFGAGLGYALGFLFTTLLTEFWFIGMINTVNFLDGVDGLAATISFIAAGVTAIHMLREGQYSVALLPIALMGTLAGFLVFNLPPAKIFIGGGALWLGFALACIGIIGGAKIALLLLVMGLPIADVVWQMFDRWWHGRSLAQGDRGHLHLRLFDQGWSAKRIVLLYASVSLAFGAAALIPQPPLLKLFTFLALAAIVILALARLSRKS